jgi:hypothetical protein
MPPFPPELKAWLHSLMTIDSEAYARELWTAKVNWARICNHILG